MGFADLHIHTSYSKDCITSVRAVLRQAQHVGLDVIAITDHDEIRGALDAREMASQYGLEVVPGVEISTKRGHLIALYIEQAPPPGLSLTSTLLAIADLGGIAIAAHPANPLPASLPLKPLLEALTHKRAKKVLKGLEIYNMGHQVFNYMAAKVSPFLPLSRVGSSDSHIYSTIGAGRTEFEGRTAAELRAALEAFETVAIPSVLDMPVVPIAVWMWQMALKNFGYLYDSDGPGSPILLKKQDAASQPARSAPRAN